MSGMQEIRGCGVSEESSEGEIAEEQLAPYAKESRQAEYIQERDEGRAAREKAIRLKKMTAEICEYGLEVRQRMFERLDEKMGYKK